MRQTLVCFFGFLWILASVPPLPATEPVQLSNGIWLDYRWVCDPEYKAAEVDELLDSLAAARIRRVYLLLEETRAGNRQALLSAAIEALPDQADEAAVLEVLQKLEAQRETEALADLTRAESAVQAVPFWQFWRRGRLRRAQTDAARNLLQIQAERQELTARQRRWGTPPGRLSPGPARWPWNWPWMRVGPCFCLRALMPKRPGSGWKPAGSA